MRTDPHRFVFMPSQDRVNCSAWDCGRPETDPVHDTSTISTGDLLEDAVLDALIQGKATAETPHGTFEIDFTQPAATFAVVSDTTYTMDFTRSAEPTCDIFWGSHGCDLPARHEYNEHVCDSQDPDGPCSVVVLESTLDEAGNHWGWLRYYHHDGTLGGPSPTVVWMD